MSLFQLRNVNFGNKFSNLTGSGGVGFTLLDTTGAEYQARTTTGVYQLTSGSGCYAAYIEFPDDWRGQILWDTGNDSTGSVCNGPKYATEQYNYHENNPKVDDIYNIEFGRWRIVNDQMIFYKEDGTTEVTRFDLFDENGVPTTDAVFERRKA